MWEHVMLSFQKDAADIYQYKEKKINTIIS